MYHGFHKNVEGAQLFFNINNKNKFFMSIKSLY